MVSGLHGFAFHFGRARTPSLDSFNFTYKDDVFALRARALLGFALVR
jgi:hypothetical protein